jgi:hypothetical protein
VGDGANLVPDGTAPCLGRLVPAQTEHESSQSNASEHTSLAARRWWHGYLPVDSTFCPPHWR